MTTLSSVIPDAAHWTKGRMESAKGGHCLLGGLLRIHRARRAERRAAEELLASIICEHADLLNYRNYWETKNKSSCQIISEWNDADRRKWPEVESLIAEFDRRSGSLT